MPHSKLYIYALNYDLSLACQAAWTVGLTTLLFIEDILFAYRELIACLL